MEQVADNTFRLGSRGHNFYVLKDGDSATVIDLGCSGEWSKLTSGLESMGLSLDSVAGVIATHSHSDHFGLAKRATEEGVAVSVHEDEESRALGTYKGRFSASTKDLPAYKPYVLWTFLPMILAGVTKLDFPKHVTTFTDGDTLDLPGNPVAIHTPGHTEGHAMFHVQDRGLLFTGDGLVTMGLLKNNPGPQTTGDPFDLNADLARQSLDRIVDVDANLLLPGHGNPWSGTPADAVALTRSVR